MVLFIIMLWEYKKHGTIISATVIYPIMWIISLLWLAVPNDFYKVSWLTLFFVIMGYIVFCKAFNFANRGKAKYSIYTAIYDDSSVSNTGLTIAFWMALIIGMLYFIRVRNYISLTSIAESLTMIRSNRAKGNLYLPPYLTYLSGIVTCTMRIFLLLYLRRTQMDILELM
jgi:hypothetical protein